MLEKLRNSPNNTDFDYFVKVVKKFGFIFDRQKGSHQIYKSDFVEDILNIQNDKGKAKPVQIKDFIKLVENKKL